MNHAAQISVSLTMSKREKYTKEVKEVGSKLSHETVCGGNCSPADLFREHMLKSCLTKLPIHKIYARCMIIVINMKLNGARSEVKEK